MPSPTPKPRSTKAVAAAASRPTAVRRADGAPRSDDPTEARRARTQEYLLAESKREAALTKQGYWF